jgi:hypothetical protein
VELRKPLIFSGVAVAGITYLLAVPNQAKIPCLFHLATGLQCPGCGLTRASLALLRGDVQSAYNFNQLVFYVPLFLVAVFLSKRSKHAKVFNSGLVIVGATATLGFFLVRNSIF